MPDTQSCRAYCLYTNYEEEHICGIAVTALADYHSSTTEA